MSHTVTVNVEFKDKDSLQKACDAVGAQLRIGPHQVRLFSSSVQADMSIKLPDWNYPIAVKGTTASLDNYGGSWGKMSSFNKLKQTYSEKVATKKAKQLGYMIQRKVKQDGTVQLTLSK